MTVVDSFASYDSGMKGSARRSAQPTNDTLITDPGRALHVNADGTLLCWLVGEDPDTDPVGTYTVKAGSQLALRVVKFDTSGGAELVRILY